MILSLFVALTVTPYLGYHLLQEKTIKSKRCRRLETSQVYKIYNRLERPLLESSMKKSTCGVTVLLLIGSVAMFFTKSVLVKCYLSTIK
jgi:multidrug efflux pump subunit AcrB